MITLMTTKKSSKQEGIDDTTSLPDRKTLFNHLKNSFGEGLVKIIKGEDVSHSFILLDIDYFKSINDIFSHGQGDKVLEGVGSIISDYKAEGEQSLLVGRWGGEEFLMVVPFDTLNAAQRIAEQIRVRIANHTFSGVSGQRYLKSQVTVSMGIHHYDLSDFSEEIRKNPNNSTFSSPGNESILDDKITLAMGDAIAGADHALNYAKFMGRNQVQVLSEFVEQEVNNLSLVRNVYFKESTKKPKELVSLFNARYFHRNQDIASKLKKHFYIIRTEIDPRDTRTQAVFADSLYKHVVSSRSTVERMKFICFIGKYS